MATTITVTSFQAACAACADAILAGDWSTARRQYAVAEAINAGLDAEVQAAEFRVRRRDSLNDLRAAIESVSATIARGSDLDRLIVIRTAGGQ